MSLLVMLLVFISFDSDNTTDVIDVRVCNEWRSGCHKLSFGCHDLRFGCHEGRFEYHELRLGVMN